MEESISGYLSEPKPVSGYLSKTGYPLKGKLASAGGTLTGKVSMPTGGVLLPHWGTEPGEVYEVDPPVDEDLVLGTEDHIMDDDFRVNKIRYEETSNPSGGLTISIAS